MKKLMIVAAAAAMVGGAFADTAYTFSATLKTTVGKSGKSTATYNLGKNNAGDFWYENNTVTNLMANPAYSAYFTTKRVGRAAVPALSSEAKKDNEWLDNYIVPLTATYNEKSANKWCDSFKVTKEGCYRVSGTKKIREIYVGDFCCDMLNGNISGWGLDVTSTPLGAVQRFGGQTYISAKKVEIFAELGDGTSNTFYLAGQGSVGKVLDDSNIDDPVDGVTSLSGNIVGVIEPPMCDYCCADADQAVAFVCNSGDQNYSLATAAYGTFSIKYNAKETKALSNSN